MLNLKIDERKIKMIQILRNKKNEGWYIRTMRECKLKNMNDPDRKNVSL